jgi:hypothetical protein
MKTNLRILALIIFFGSLWGFSEIFIGSFLADQNLPYGIIMTGFFAMIFLTMSRVIYNHKGMQLGIGLTAGALKYFNPFIGCNVCSAIAIMAEGLIFELIWNYFIKYDFSKIDSIKLKISFGIFTSYTVYVFGYIITQILTPMIYSSFYIENLISFIPQILSKGLLAGFLGIISITLAIYISNIKIQLKDIIYYPTTIGVSSICWFIVLTNWYFFIS